jgi:hypothetical protein
MAEPAWLSYAGAVSGAVGAITGIAGAVMGYISYRRTEALKTLDLRLELRRAETDLRREVEDLPKHLNYAKRSRTAVASAAGRLQSGAMKKWLEEWDADLALAKAMAASVPSRSSDYVALDQAALEEKLIKAHAAAGNVRALRGKYDATLASDDKEREQIREDLRVRNEGKFDGAR